MKLLANKIRSLYGEPSMVFSSLIRSMIIPSDGCQLFVADFSKIEVAVLWWLADNKPGLEVLNSGKDPYIYMAARNTGRFYEEIDKEGDERQLGKAQVLGCGFGMGFKKFKTTAWDMYRLKLTRKQSKEAVKNYREANVAVPELWKNYEQAAITAIEDRVSVKIGKCKFFCKDSFLWVELPSGRRLAYREPRISWRVREYEYEEYKWVRTQEGVRKKKLFIETRITSPMKTIEFLGLAPDKRSLALERTWGGTLTENIVQAVARDLMKHGEILLEEAGYQVLLTVHDEIICERQIGSVEKFTSIMCTRPKWADQNLPIDAKGWSGTRYRK